MAKDQSTPRREKPVFSFGKVSMTKDPRVYAAKVPAVADRHKRCLGIDLGTNCGVSFCDFIPGTPIVDMTVVMGQWDLSVGPYDTGPLRHIRLKQFLQIANPDLIMYEEVKYDPPAELVRSREMGPGAIVARVATAAEFLGGLKTTLSTWAEENNVPAHGLPIAAIKKFATDKGNANKVDMINAANVYFGTNFESEGYESTGVDNIVDAAYCCAMGITMYSEGLT